MKKTLVSALVLGLLAGSAYAQTNVTIYGQVDTGLIKETGSDTRMGNNENNIVGFKGTEDLGGGTKAVFQLERRFNLNDGTEYSDNNAVDTLQGSNGAEWQGAAYVGLSNDTYGTVTLGRVNDLAIESYSAVDPYAYFSTGIAGSAMTPLYAEQMPNTIRYDSPEMAGLSLKASYTLGKDTHNDAKPDDPFNYKSYGNDGFAVGINYANGGLWATANYDRLADTDKSWFWNAGLGYTYEGFTVTLGYQATTMKSAAADAVGYGTEAVKQKDWIIGLMYETGPHTFKFSYNRGDLDSDGDYDGNMNKYALGYNYAMSKRTSLYAMVAYTDSDNDDVGAIYNTNRVESDSVTGVQFGINHKF